MRVLDTVEARNLACIRGGRHVFREVGFCLKAGELLTIEGPNGSGKTSLLRLLAGFLRMAAGTVRFRARGNDIADAEERGKYAGWLGHQDAIKPQLTPQETLAFYAALYGLAGLSADICASLDEVGLGRAAAIPCQYLSAGQRRRLALARLKLTGRPLWLLDEPLAALDAQAKDVLRRMIVSHCSAGGIAVAATHEPLGLSGQNIVLA